MDLKQTERDRDGIANDNDTHTATVGHLEIQLSALQKAHQNTQERLGSVEREEKSLRECLAAEQKKVNEKIVSARQYQ